MGSNPATLGTRSLNGLHVIPNPFTLVGVRRIDQVAEPVFIRVVGRAGEPFPDVPVRLELESQANQGITSSKTDESGLAMLQIPADIRERVYVVASLPEGDIVRLADRNVFQPASSPIVIHSLSPAPRAILSLPEITGFVLGAGLIAAGVMGRRDVFTGIGTSLSATAGFSMIFRHLR